MTSTILANHYNNNYSYNKFIAVELQQQQQQQHRLETPTSPNQTTTTQQRLTKKLEKR